MLVGAGVGDDEPLAGGEHGVEEQLAVLAAGVALAGHRAPREHVIAVDRLLAGEGVVVHAEQAHDAVRHRAHRGHRAHGEAAGPEARPARAPGELVGEQHPHVGEAQRHVVAGVPGGGAEGALEVADLPALARGHVGQGEDGLGEGVHPLGGRAGVLEPVEALTDAGEQLAHPADEVDRAAADVVEGHDAADLQRAVGRDGDPDEESVEAEPPGPLGLHVEGEGGPPRLVVAPPDAGVADPPGHRREVVVVEAEAAPDRPARREVEHLARGEAPAGEADDAVGDVEQGVGGPQRPVGQPYPQPVGGVGVDAVGVSAVLAEAEGRADERRIGLDVGAHDEHVARLEGGVVVEQPDEHLAQHLDLPGRPVARVDLDRAVVGRHGPGGALALVGDVVVAQIGLQPLEHRPRLQGAPRGGPLIAPCPSRRRWRASSGTGGRPQHPHQLA